MRLIADIPQQVEQANRLGPGDQMRQI
jgi:hypothetical protein